ncbi:MAG: protein phosphatase 2C domain-containing protein [Microbacteriaceae bacterium]|nr:protein phosphatase 2C domain-containing protein [Microbacteriaceae bacterium]
MTLTFTSAIASHVGMVRSNNQDSGYAGLRLFFVADGMGGHAGGDVASALVTRFVAEIDGTFDDPADAAQALSERLLDANTHLSDTVFKRPELSGMGTTFSGFITVGDKLAVCHIGDSRLYRFAGGDLLQETTDHTFVQKLVDSGQITEEEAKVHPRRSVLMRVLGDVDSMPEIDTAILSIEEGDIFLLCSDGLCGYVEEAVIENELRKGKGLQQTVDNLIDRALENGAPDNVTVALVKAGPAGVAVKTGENAVVTGRKTAKTDTAVLDVITDPTGGAGQVAEAGQTASAGTDSTGLQTEQSETGTAQTETGTGQADTDLATGTTPDIAANETENGTVEIASPPTGSLTKPERTDTLTLPQARFVGSAASKEHSEVPVSTARSRIISARKKRKLQEVPEAHFEPRVDEYLEELIAELRRGNRRRRVIWAFGSLIALLIVASLAFFGYQWTQTKYYVGTDGESIIIYRGVQQNIGPIQLSNPIENTKISLHGLAEYQQQQVKRTLPADSLEDAREIVARLGVKLHG